MGTRLRDKGEGWKDVIGMPTEWDKKNLTILINNFMKEKFKMPNGQIMSGAQWAAFELKDARESHQIDNPWNEKGIKIKDSDMRISMAMPKELWIRISDTAPTLMTDREHHQWFLKNFPQFKVTR